MYVCIYISHLLYSFIHWWMLWLSLFILLIMNTYAVSVSWILWIKPQRTWKHISLQDQILISIPLDRHKLSSPSHWLICSTKIYGVPSVCQAWTQSWIAACLTQEELEKIDTPRPAFLIVTMSAGPQSNNGMSSMEHGERHSAPQGVQETWSKKKKHSSLT